MADIGQIRYYFEHRFLPKVWYDPKIILPISLKKNPGAIRQNWKNILQQEGVEDIYPENAYDIQMFELDPHTACIRILCPEPEKEPQCYWIYMLFTYNMKKFFYFSVEKGGFLNDGPFLCGWDKTFTHKNFGGCPLDIEKALDMAISIFGQLGEAAEAPKEGIQVTEG